MKLSRIFLVSLLLTSSTAFADELPGDVEAQYIKQVTAAINAAVINPKRGPFLSGDEDGAEVTVSFDCTDDVPSNLKIEVSSHYRSLDRAAWNAVKSAHLPIVPPELLHRKLHLSIPVKIPPLR